MKKTQGGASQGSLWRARCRAFTLIELMVVIAIITLLISILLPTLGKARERGKVVKTKANLKSIGDGAELYRNENDSDQSTRLTNGYPPSAMGPDDTLTTTEQITGAHWLVRHLMGKDMFGYAPPRNVPPGLPPDQWYEFTNGKPNVDRVGPYLDGEAVKTAKTKDLPEGGNNQSLIQDQQQPVFVDTWGFPILYYVANPTQAARPRAAIAAMDYTTSGIYTMKDNGLFTGQCQGTMCQLPPWDLGDGDHHNLGDFGPDIPPTPCTIRNNPRTFPAIIMDWDLYKSSMQNNDCNTASVVPYRKDSFLLFSPGKDGSFGTPDDVTNFR